MQTTGAPLCFAMIEKLTPRNIWEQWNLEPQFLIPLCGVLLLYTIGYARTYQKPARGPAIGFLNWLAFLGGCTTIAIALFSPVNELASQLFSAHMAQHVLLLLVAPPLFVSSSALQVLFSLLPSSTTRFAVRLWRSSRIIRWSWSLVNRPFILWLLYAAVMWLWHMPVLYQAALSNESIHMLQHLMFLVVALGFWAGILHSQPSRKKQVAFGASVLYAFAMALQTGMLGALLTFASHAWYERYATTASFWGLSALDDQQLAGLILWIPGGLVYVVTGMVLFVIWLNAVERDVRERERQAQLEYPAPPTLTEKSGQLTWLDK